MRESNRASSFFGRIRTESAMLAASLSLAPAIMPAAAATPTLLWRDASLVGVRCLATGERGNDQALAADLCERVRRLASRGSPVPVRVMGLGDPAVLAPGTVTLLVHASVQPDRMMAFSLRPFRASADQSSVLFAAAPRAVPLRAAGALDAALAAALSETLPWQAAPQGPRALPARR